MRIGPHALPNPVILAPMAGVTDRPFRRLCRELGAGLVVSEMVTSDTRLWQSAKSSRRLDHSGEPGPISVQIAGADPRMMAEAARANVDLGAQIIDINMGCPAKKVCKRAAGSALLSEPELVARILQSVVAAVPVPVTLKIRTGPTRDNRNAVLIARIAEQSGIQALAIHGRTRADRFNGEAEFETIGEVARSVEIPVIANGDIDSPQKAQRILQSTGAGGIMIGRAAQGNPWIFQDTVHYLEHGRLAPAPSVEEVRARVLAHLSDLHDFYGTYSGVRIARKHLGWYTQNLPGGEHFRRGFNNLEKATDQRRAIKQFFQQISASSDRLRIGCYGGVSARNKDGALAA
ncbi:tRNA-dihydrouridine synthase B [Alloalcanivorax dieselolei B5]|uniref:tRNA-dihydrouridine synthase B n=1 Tax=Alcanivorax dieselolei (strain DSM 16502 / CGMCC 1.3690 / MCCC 1A00001 / B-5) TaxID=930169 RepID=K0C9X6_ALCDB|nr:tRNA dihydrouridine synthase DusB [Alloalcanivorax dieselolei]AFT69295.1 tRNA-dihydrouridine synthase B [Alloalcanivorax dieselolei B5]GGJ91488.1 tRNA-dihydrouridine synthase B [Alloalcanivorax dieselolei]